MSNPLAGLKYQRIRTNTDPQLLADAIGVALGSYYRYEKGTRRIYLDRAIALAKTIGCSVDDLTRAPTPDAMAAAAVELEGWEPDE